MQTRKETAWKKSREFGDVFGGRTKRKIPDKILRRVHSLPRPSPGDVLPIIIEDNPSRDFVFPLSGAEVRELFQAFPKAHKRGLTHIWLRKVSGADYEDGELPLACFMCGSGVRAIVLYPFPADLRIDYGRRKPTNRHVNKLLQYCSRLEQQEGRWVMQWTLPQLRRYFAEFLFPHELAHHVDEYSRRWSDANLKVIEDFADDYAVLWLPRTQRIFAHLERRRTRSGPNVAESGTASSAK